MSENSITPIQPIHILSDYTRTYELGVNQVTAHITHSQVANGPVRLSEVIYMSYSSAGELRPVPPPLGGKIDFFA